MLLRLIRRLIAPAGKDSAAAAAESGLAECRRLERAGELEAALACYRARAAADPADMDALVAIANTLTSLWRIEEAVAACERALAIAPSNTELFSAFLLYSHYSVNVGARELFERHARYGKLVADSVTPSYRHRWRASAEPGRRLRVGYVSRNLSRHSVGYFVEPVIELHDRERFEIYCYYTHPLSDDVTAKLARTADVWRHLPDVEADVLAAYIEEDEIDIAVDLGGHTKLNRLPAFAREPAPVQLTWLGYPDTTGMRSIGHRISDALADPEGTADTLHSEQLVRLPPPFICYRPPSDAPPVVPRANPDEVVFGSFNTLAKLTEPVVALWCRILSEVPKSRLLLKGAILQNREAAARVRERFAAGGVGADRLELRGWSDERTHHLSAYGEVDIALDTFPYHGTTTTCEALWMGVPVVTLAGDVHMARVGASLLRSVGLETLVAKSPAEYVQAAVSLAGDAPRRREMRLGMRERLLASPLLDHAGFTRKLEAAYREMWRASCRDRREKADAS